MKRSEAAHFQLELPKMQSQQQYYDTATSKEHSFKEFYLKQLHIKQGTL